MRRDLARVVGLRHADDGDVVREVYGRDSSPAGQLRARAGERGLLPDVVVWPGTTDELLRVVRYARERRIALTPYGGGLRVAGGRAGIVVDLKRMHRLVEVDGAHRRVRAQAGARLLHLDRALAVDGLAMGLLPDDAGTATLGGWLASGAGADRLLGVVAVSGGGELLRATAEEGGAELARLLAGSGGALAVVTEATLAVEERPDGVAAESFRMGSLEAGLEALRELAAQGLRPSLLGLHDPLDDLIAGATGRPSGEREESASRLGRIVPGRLPAALQPLVTAARQRSVGLSLLAPAVLNRAAELLPSKAVLVVAFEARARAQAEAQLRHATSVVRRCGGTALGPETALRVWRRRHGTLHAQAAVFAGGGWVDALAVDTTWDRVGRSWAAVRRAVWESAFVSCHVEAVRPEGCRLAFTLVGPAITAARGLESWERTLLAAHRAALESGGATDGQLAGGPPRGVEGASARAALAADALGESGLRLARALKEVLDPDALLLPVGLS